MKLHVGAHTYHLGMSVHCRKHPHLSSSRVLVLGASARLQLISAIASSNSRKEVVHSVAANWQGGRQTPVILANLPLDSVRFS